MIFGVTFVTQTCDTHLLCNSLTLYIGAQNVYSVQKEKLQLKSGLLFLLQKWDMAINE